MFRQWISQPCPTCGATTAWAHAVRGEFHLAAGANFGGLLLCVLTIVTTPWLLISAAVGKWITDRPRTNVLLVAGTALLIIVLADWLRKLSFDLTGWL